MLTMQLIVHIRWHWREHFSRVFSLRFISVRCFLRWRRSRASTTKIFPVTRPGSKCFTTLSWTMSWVRTPVWKDDW